MPNKLAAKKYLRVSKKRHQHNLLIKKNLKAVVKKVRESIEDSGATKKAEELLKEAVKVIDRAAQKKVIKKNTAARKKTRLYKKLHTVETKSKVKTNKTKAKKK